MLHVPYGAPFDEQGGKLRGVLDLAAGRYPGFLFGLPVGRLVPVFHFHQVTRADLAPALAYLRDNGYRTTSLDALARFMRDGVHPGPKTVLLTFDDAWSSLWLAAGPLLAEYGMTAVTYAIPARTVDADAVRPTIADDPRVDPAAADAADQPFVTWPELKALSDSGVIDVQSHTWSHSMVFSDPTPIGVVDPGFAREDFLNRPRIWRGGRPIFLDNSRLGAPLFARRSRMSDAHEYVPDEGACAALEGYVAERGGAAFFRRSTWRDELEPHLRRLTGRTETDDERRLAIEGELDGARRALEGRLGRPVRHVCLPWGVGGATTSDALVRLGFSTAVQNRLPGRLAPGAGDDPFFIKRLHSRFIPALPGRGRKLFFSLA